MNAIGCLQPACAARRELRGRETTKARHESSFRLTAKKPSIGRVLIVDDDEGICRALCHVVRLCCGEGVPVGTVQAAEQQLAAHSDFAALIVDQLLPGGAGLSLIEAVRAGGNKLPTRLITGDDDKHLANRAYSLGAACFFKPLSTEDIKEWIRREVEQPSADREERVANQVDLWRETYDLTVAECELLFRAALGDDRDAIAKTMACMQGTLRSHCHELLAKTGDASLSDAVSRLLRAMSDPRIARTVP